MHHELQLPRTTEGRGAANDPRPAYRPFQVLVERHIPGKLQRDVQEPVADPGNLVMQFTALAASLDIWDKVDLQDLRG